MTDDEEFERLLDEGEAEHNKWFASLSPADQKAFEAYMAAGGGFTDSFQQWLDDHS